MNSEDWQGGPWDVPKTKYRMMHAGDWRSVMNMYDASNHETTLPMRCAKAVLFVTRDHWVAIQTSPGDIVETPGYKTEEWETVNHVKL